MAEKFEPRIIIRPQPRKYEFTVNGMFFSCRTDARDENGMHPKDVLAADLKEIVAQLEAIPLEALPEERPSAKPFSLPPVRPNPMKRNPDEGE
jgi:hypothetical protein